MSIAIQQGVPATELEDYPPASAPVRRVPSPHLIFWGFSLFVCLATYPDVVFGGRTFLSIGMTAALYERAPYAARFAGRVPPAIPEIDAGSEAWAVHPWAFEERRAIAAGSFPIWNTHEGFGHPQFANGQTQTLNPLHALVLINPDSPLLWDLHFLLLRFVAALFSCYLLRELGVRPALCLVGGAFAAIHGVFNIFLNRADLEAYTWMTVALFAVAWLRNRPTVPRAMAVALAVAFCLMSGHPEPAFSALLGVAGFAIGLLAWKEWRLRYVAALSGGALTAVLISAVYWVPFVAFVARSSNAHPEGTGEGDRPAFLLLQWLAPAAFHANKLFALFGGTHQNFGFLGAAMGTLAILGVASAALLHGQRRRLLWLAAPLLLAMKIHGIAGSGWIGRLPFASRMPTVVYLQFPALYLLGIGGIVALSAVVDAPAPRRNLVLSVTVAVLLLVIGLAPLYTPADGTLSHLWPRAAALTLVLALGTAALSWWIAASGGRLILSSIVLLMLVGGELGAYRKALSRRGNPAAEGPYITWLKERQRQGAPFRVMGLGHYLMPNFATIYGLDDVRVCDALQSPEYVTFIRRFLQTELAWQWFLSGEANLGFDAHNPIFNWLNVRYLVGDSATLAPEPSALQRRLLESGRPEWTPRAYEINGRSLPVLYQHPNDAGSIQIDVSRDYPVLAFSLAQDPAIWNAPGDGATYSMVVAPPREPELEVFSLEIDPKRRMEDRRWFDGRADLSRWAGRSVRLSLEAKSFNTASDWGGWGDLHWENVAGMRQRDQTRSRGINLRAAYRDAERPEAVVFENPSAWPRIFAVAEPHLERSADAVLDRIDALKDSPEPLAVVGDDFPRTVWDALCGAVPCPSGPSGATISDVRYGQRDLSLTISTERRMVLTVGDAFFPGWRARIDGRESPVFRSNYVFRGLIVPPGSHRVEMSYWPREWTLAMVLEVIGLVSLAVASVIALRRPREH